jgi:hypothetical protein
MWRFRFYRRDIMSLGNFVYHLIAHLAAAYVGSR